MLLAGQADSTKSLPVSSSPRSGNSNIKTILTKSASCRNVHSLDEEMHNIKTIAATIVRAQKKQVANLNLHRQQVDQSIQQAQDKNHQERLAQLQKLEEMQQQHFKSQLIALDMKEKRIMSRMKKMERRIHKTMELSKQVREVKDHRHDASLQRVEQDVTSVRLPWMPFKPVPPSDWK
jgi:chromosome segregation ATPase